MPQSTLFHITRAEAWQSAVACGEYSTADLPSTGFIHLCSAEQTAFVLDKFFPIRDGLVMIHINAQRLRAEVRYEEAEPGMEFPHLYGPLNLDAVLRVEELL
ncbi:MAG: DUF952 domain-containing protein [Bryobacterales bacterium]|nr:DUF952 domain-containing protein [Bryobacterales bacterium]